jgi:hypothetical protein
MKFSWLTPNKNKKNVASQSTFNKQNLQVNTVVVVNYDPFGAHSTRDAIITGIIAGGYQVRFTSTKGSSLHGDVVQSYQRADGTWVSATQATATITYNQILKVR